MSESQVMLLIKQAVKTGESLLVVDLRAHQQDEEWEQEGRKKENKKAKPSPNVRPGENKAVLRKAVVNVFSKIGFMVPSVRVRSRGWEFSRC